MTVLEASACLRRSRRIPRLLTRCIPTCGAPASW
jgi:hypothetical protein